MPDENKLPVAPASEKKEETLPSLSIAPIKEKLTEKYPEFSKYVSVSVYVLILLFLIIEPIYNYNNSNKAAGMEIIGFIGLAITLLFFVIKKMKKTGKKRFLTFLVLYLSGVVFCFLMVPYTDKAEKGEVTFFLKFVIVAVLCLAIILLQREKRKLIFKNIIVIITVCFLAIYFFVGDGVESKKAERERKYKENQEFYYHYFNNNQY